MDKQKIILPDFIALRKEFPVTSKWIYLNIANKAPLPKCSQNAIRDFLREMNELGGKDVYSIIHVEETRERLAKLLGTEVQNIAFVKNTSEGLNIAAQALCLKPGDNVIQADIDHPNQKYAWKRLEALGVELRWVRNREGCLPIEDFIDLIDDKTRVIAVSYVTFAIGIRINLPALSEVCHKHNIRFMLDAIQGIGVLATPLPMLGADVVVCGGHKGLLGLPGTGFLYCKEEIISQMEPPFFARACMVPEAISNLEIDLVPDAHRFEIGSYNYLGLRILGESVQFLTNIGLRNIENRVQMLTNYLIKLLEIKGKKILTPRIWRERAGIVSIQEKYPKAMEAFLREKGIIVSTRDSALRISPHFYNTKEELEKLVSLL